VSYVSELDYIIDLVEERLSEGKFRWLANFSEIQRDYAIEDVVFPIYAYGSLQERGFFLSKIYSALVTPKYKTHFLLYTSREINSKVFRKLILLCKKRFGVDNWVFLSIVQSQPLQKAVKDAVKNSADKSIGVATFSLASKEKVTSDNVLGKGLAKQLQLTDAKVTSDNVLGKGAAEQLQLTDAKFDAFDWPDYLKSFTIIFLLGILVLLFIALSGSQEAVQPLTLTILAVFSIILGYRLYKTRYHTTLTLSKSGFQLKKGKNVIEDKWSNYKNATLFITPQLETCIRLHSKDETFDLPISRVGLARKDIYSTIRELVRKK
jgi:hypothetical protein